MAMREDLTKTAIEIGKRIRECRMETKRADNEEYQKIIKFNNYGKSDKKKYTDTNYYKRQEYLSIPDLAEILGIEKVGMVSDWEKGKKLPTINNIIKLANLFHVNIDWLLFGVSPKNSHKQSLIIYNEPYIIGQRLKDWREEQDITRDKITETLECSLSTVYSLENGNRQITTAQILLLYKKFNLASTTLYK